MPDILPEVMLPIPRMNAKMGKMIDGSEGSSSITARLFFSSDCMRFSQAALPLTGNDTDEL